MSFGSAGSLSHKPTPLNPDSHSAISVRTREVKALMGINLTSSKASGDSQISDEAQSNSAATTKGDTQSSAAADASRKAQGMGLRTMQYRAGMICGTLQIERRETGGTRVKCASLSAGKVISDD